MYKENASVQTVLYPTITNQTGLARQGFNVFLVLVVRKLPWMFYRAPNVEGPERLPMIL